MKGLGNLPNVIYLLSYDEVRFCRSISYAINRTEDIDPGSSYLEKVVQYKVHVPIIENQKIESLFLTELNKILEITGVTMDSGVLPTVWQDIAAHYLHTPRDIKRFSNNYLMSLSAVHENTDPLDLFVLEILHLFEPTVYHWIRNNLPILAS